MRRTARLVLVILLVSLSGYFIQHVRAGAQGKAEEVPDVAQRPAADWPTFNGDLAASRHSLLTDLNPSNVGRLAEAWTFKLGKPNVTGLFGGFEATPLVVQGTMYLPTSDSVVALAADSGREEWRYVFPAGAPSRRGVAYWAGDSSNPARIFVTFDHKSIMALDARTGQPVPAFGRRGQMEMPVTYEAAPTVFKNLVLVGSNGVPGGTYAIDARTGVRVWEFRSMAQPGSPGGETWPAGNTPGRMGGSQWTFSMSVDVERGIVYATYDSPGPNDYYGGDRPGAGLFGSSVVALDAATGKMKWYFQVTHHDIFDYDLPSPAGLFDVTINGRTIPALVVTPKSGYMYILDRVTGAPIFGVEERPVPQSDVPGEKSSPTQPFPLKPPPIARVGFTLDDLVTAADTTEEHARFCRDLVTRAGGVVNAGPFTPYVYRPEGAPPRSTVIFPGPIGGPNWGGTATDPSLGYIFVNTSDEAGLGWIEKAPGAASGYRRFSLFGSTSRFHWSEGNPPGLGNSYGAGGHAWPCQKPPWGRLVAVNAATGEIAWTVPLGVTDELPEGKRNTGRTNIGGITTTAGGLLFVGATNDGRFRAFESKSGRELWSARLPMNAHAVPITYRGRNGRQYVAILAAGGGGIDDPAPPGSEAVHVFSLP